MDVLNIANINPYGPDDGSVELKRYSVNFSINLSFHLDYLFINLYIYIYIYVRTTNSSAWDGCDTRSIFKQSLTGVNSEFSFS